MYVIRNNLKHPSTIFENAVFKVDSQGLADKIFIYAALQMMFLSSIMMMLGLKKKKLSWKFKTEIFCMKFI